MTSITDNLKAMIGEAVERFSNGDKVEWDIALIFNPQGPPVYFVSMVLPSAVIGDYHQAGGLLERGHGVVQTEIDELVRGALERLRDERTQALTGNDNVTSSSLIVP